MHFRSGASSGGSTPRSGDPLLRWQFWLLLVVALGLAWGLTPQASATLGFLDESPPPSPIETPSPLPTPSPSPTPPSPRLIAVQPNMAVNTQPTIIHLAGQGFVSGSQVFLRAADRPNAAKLALPTRYQSEKELVARVPAGLSLGLYHIGVDNRNGTPPSVLERAFKVVQAVDDLSSTPDRLWTDPHRLTVGEPVEIGLHVVRTGGNAGLPPFPVDFYVRQDGEETYLGRGVVPGLGPDSEGSTSPVRWTPTRRGEATLIALIDPDNQIAESDEQNNRVERTVHVRMVAAQDETPPVARELKVNDGQQIVADRAISLTVTAEDPPPNATGPSKVLYVESHWHRSAGQGGGFWAPVQWTDWMDYSAQPHAWTLDAEPGLRYMQAWVADGAGNISARAANTLVNYIPGEDTLLAGEIRVYRQWVPAGRCLHVRVEPQAPDQDPDLYIWEPGDPPQARYSIQGPGQVDELYLTPTQDTRYQIEVEALTDAHIRLQVEILAGCNRQGMRPQSGDVPAAKAPRSEPAIPPEAEPEGGGSAPTVEIVEYLAFITLVGDPIEPAATSQIYLPQVAR